MSEKQQAQKLIDQAKSENRKILTEYESKEVLRSYGIKTTVEQPAYSADEAASVAEKIGFPVVLKVYSPDITHKSDVGGVKVNLKNTDEVKKAYNEIIASAKQHKPDAKNVGALVENMVTPGQEVIIGATKDAQFGPMVMFGLGGIFVEVLKDVVFRLPPISKKEALAMMSEIKGAPILKGVRGAKPADVEAVAEIIEKVSKIVMDLPEIAELDMNPVFAYEKGATVVDARILL
jgi:acetate---CoA ligase (ADP-forming) subunit beta